MDIDSRIRVVARIRPKTRKEVGERITVTRHEDFATLNIAGSTDEDLEDVRASAFRFDSVYNDDDDQVTVYEEECAEIVDHVLAGDGPGTVMAFGQTGSGKTYSILGKTGADGGLHADSGVFLRVFCDLFRSGVKEVKLSAVELYLDDVFDLLDGRVKRKLRDAGTEVLIAGMKEVAVSSLEQVLEIFSIANSARSVTATNMNDQSSRSHAIFFISVPTPYARKNPNATGTPPTTPLAAGSSASSSAPALTTRLMLVDLAGSERIKKSKAEGAAVAEAAAINSSLSTLGTVVHSMYVGSGHIPYRDSKLTGVLKSTFANAKCRVLLIGQFSPVLSNSLESISTGKFCDRVKGLACGSPAGLGGAGVGGSGDPELDKRMLSTLQSQAELSAELRIARALVGFGGAGIVEMEQQQQPQSPGLFGGAAGHQRRKSFKPTVYANNLAAARQQNPFAPAPRFTINTDDDAAALRTEIESDIRRQEEEEARVAAQRCEQLTQRMFQKHVAKRVQFGNDLVAWEQKTLGIKSTAQSFSQNADGEAQQQLHDAKKAKKRRVVLEEKVNDLKNRQSAVSQSLSATPENYTLPPSLVDFEADDDPEAAAKEKRAECNHSIVSDFYSHWRTVQRLHDSVINLDTKSNTILLDMSKMRATSPEGANSGGDHHDDQAQKQQGGGKSRRRSLTAADGGIEALSSLTSFHVWQFASDVVTFSWKRAADISEGLTEEGESWAWSDVIGCSRFLVDAANWSPNPITLVPEFPKQPVDNDNLMNQTRIDDEPVTFSDTDSSGDDQSDHAGDEKFSIASGLGVPTASGCSTNPSNMGSAQNSGISAKSSPAAAGSLTLSPPPPRPPAAIAADTTAAAPSSNAANNSNLTSLSGLPGLPGMVKQTSTSSSGKENLKEAQQPTAANADDAGDGTKKGGKSSKRKKTPEEIAQAEKHYLMGIYDSKTLTSDIVKFLGNGTRVMKHGRSGDPHKRHAWIKNTTLYWIDPDPANRATAQKHSISIPGISSVILGQHSKVFKRNPATAGSSQYYLSFTCQLADGSRTLDFTAENLVDFEAWVIGLTSLCQVDAAWGKALPVGTMEPNEYSALTSFEKSLCERENILPSIFHKVRAKVIEIRNDVSMHVRAFGGNSELAYETMGRDGIHVPKMNDEGAILMTKGELRYHCSQNNVDIFRVCKLWEYFRDQGFIFDSEYVPMCSHGRVERR